MVDDVVLVDVVVDDVVEEVVDDVEEDVVEDGRVVSELLGPLPGLSVVVVVVVVVLLGSVGTRLVCVSAAARSGIGGVPIAGIQVSPPEPALGGSSQAPLPDSGTEGDVLELGPATVKVPDPEWQAVFSPHFTRIQTPIVAEPPLFPHRFGLDTEITDELIHPVEQPRLGLMEIEYAYSVNGC